MCLTVSQKTKDRFKLAFVILALIGIVDMSVQASTKGKVQPIHMVLTAIFGVEKK
jgi:hypothetical protein